MRHGVGHCVCVCVCVCVCAEVDECTELTHSGSNKAFETERYLRVESVAYVFVTGRSRKATVSFIVSVRLEHLGSPLTDFHEIWYLSIFSKVC